MAEKLKKAAVMGWPLRHSLSPALHGYWLSQHNIAGSYTALPVQPDHLAAALKSLAKDGFCGVNLTVPHKEAAVAYMDEMDPVATAIGAVNTVIVQGGKLIGRNTDAYGFISNVKQHYTFRRKHKAIVLGAGGAARAVVKALKDEGFGHIVITNRTPDKAAMLAKHFAMDAASWDHRAFLLKDADMLVNTTTLGMQDAPALDMDLSLLPEDALVTDIVYTPLMTELLAAAKKRGNPIVDGLGMLLHQAVPCFEAWFGVRPQVTEDVRKHVLGNAA